MVESEDYVVKKKKLEWKGIIYVLPAIIVLAFLDFYPIFESVYYSLTDFNSVHFFKYGYVGLANFIYVFTSSDLWTVIGNTLVWSIGSTVVMVPAGFLLALIMNQKKMRGKTIYRTMYLFPWAFPAFITILVWSNMLAYTGGVANEFLNVLGFKSLDWLTSPKYAMISLILVNLFLLIF